MAKGLLSDILGFNPVEFQQQRFQQFMSPIKQASNPYERIGASLGTLLGGAFFNQDPMLQKASDIQSAFTQSASAFTPNTPEFFKDLAARLESYPEAQAVVLQKAAEAEGAVEKTFRETQKFVGDFPEALAGEAQKVEASVLNRLRRAGVNVETDPNTGELLTPIPPEVLAQVGQLPEVQRLNQLTQIATRSSIKMNKEDSPADQRVRETKIGELVGRGYSKEFASDIVDGNIRYEVVPQTGNVRRINRLTGGVSEVPIQNLPVQEQAALLAADEESQKTTLWEAADKGTGAWSSLRSGASRVFGQIPGVPQAQKTEEARQFLFSATNDLARSLVNNPRFPVAEVERVIREAGTQPSAFDTPDLLKSRLKVLDSFLRDRLKTAEQDAANANLPQDVRVAQATNAASIRSFLPKLGVPSKDIGKPPKGITSQQWNAMTPSQRDAFKTR